MEYPCAPACWWWRKIPRIGLDVISETLLPLVGRVASNNQGDESDCSGSTYNDPAQRPGPRDAWIATRARWPGSLQRMAALSYLKSSLGKPERLTELPPSP